MNIAFDMAAWVRTDLEMRVLSNTYIALFKEILGSLCNGSTLCMRGKTSKEWRELLKTVHIVIATPSMMGESVVLDLQIPLIIPRSST